MNNMKKFITWIFFTLLIYFITYKLIIYFDPINQNIKGIKSLSSFVALLVSFFIGSNLAKK